MLTLISVTCDNKPYRGGIELHSTTTQTSIGSITSIVIKRKRYDKLGWNTIHTITVDSVDDLVFDLFDITAVCGKSYYYAIDIKNGNTTIETEQLPLTECWFSGVFIGDANKQYIAGTNYKTDVKRNTEVAYVTTLNSRVPYRISNSQLNYSTGTTSGLFLEVTSDGKKFVPDYDHAYSESVIDFLTDGGDKILKTDEGQAWLVSIDESPSSPYNDGFTGMNAVQFEWTEIGDLPVLGMVVD